MSIAFALVQSSRVRALILVLPLLNTFGLAQSSDKSKPAAPDLHTPDLHTPDSGDILRQMNRALEDLAAKVSPAVVQIQTTGYGPLHEDGDKGETALIVQQHAVGSGVIVDPNGYIMTNAHVVEGARRIRVALPMPANASRTIRLRASARCSMPRSSECTRKVTWRCSRLTRPTCRHFRWKKRKTYG